MIELGKTLSLGHFENMLGTTSALSSHFMDCLSAEHYVELDDDLLVKTQKIIESIEFVQDRSDKDYEQTIQSMKELHKRLEEAHAKEIGGYESDEEDCETLSNSLDIIRYYCEIKWEIRQEKHLRGVGV